MTATVVITCHRAERWDYLVRAVQSARAQSPRPAEVIVVVDHNPALFARACADLPGVTVLTNGTRRGAAGTRGTGIAYARTPLVALLDDDAYAHPGWLANLIAPFADPTVAGTGGLVRPNWERPRPSWLPEELLWALDEVPERGPWSASVAVRREVFVAAGGFDAMPGEDGRWVYVPDAVVDHPVPTEHQGLGYLLSRCYASAPPGAVSRTLRWAATLATAGIVMGAGRVTKGYRRPQWTKRYGTH